MFQFLTIVSSKLHINSACEFIINRDSNCEVIVEKL